MCIESPHSIYGSCQVACRQLVISSTYYEHESSRVDIIDCSHMNYRIYASVISCTRRHIVTKQRVEHWTYCTIEWLMIGRSLNSLLQFFMLWEECIVGAHFLFVLSPHTDDNAVRQLIRLLVHLALVPRYFRSLLNENGILVQLAALALRVCDLFCIVGRDGWYACRRRIVCPAYSLNLKSKTRVLLFSWDLTSRLRSFHFQFTKTHWINKLQS